MTEPEVKQDVPQDANEGCVGPKSEQAGRVDGCAGCPNQAICQSGQLKAPDAYLETIRQRLANIKRIVLVLSGKGGVGKSTLTKELGFTAARRGISIGLMDADICGPSIPRITGCREEEVHRTADGWEPVAVDDNMVIISSQFLLGNPNEAIVWRGPRKNRMIKDFFGEVCWGALDLLLIDTPPGTTDEHISLVNIIKETAKIDGAILITTPQEVAVADVRREINFCIKSSVPILGVVENMSTFVCPCCGKPSDIFPTFGNKSAGQRLSEEYNIPFLGTIPMEEALMTSCEQGVPISEHAPKSASGKAIEDLTETLLKLINLHEKAKKMPE